MKRGSSMKIAGVFAGALVLGALAGAAIVYSGSAFEGNAIASAEASCAADEAFAARIASGATGEVAAMAPVEEPLPVGDFLFANAEGETEALSDFAGQILLVNVWATWCVPCRVEMPELDQLKREAGGEAFDVVAISVDNGPMDRIREFYEETGLTDLRIYQDDTMTVFDRLKGAGLAYGLPISLLVDEEGCVRGAMNAPADWASEDAFDLIDAVTAPDGGSV